MNFSRRTIFIHNHSLKVESDSWRIHWHYKYFCWWASTFWIILSWMVEIILFTCFCTWKETWPTCHLLNSSFMMFFIFQRKMCLTWITFCMSAKSMTCIGMPVVLETPRLHLWIVALISWGSKEALQSEVATIILEKSPSGTSYSPQYTLM